MILITSDTCQKRGSKDDTVVVAVVDGDLGCSYLTWEEKFISSSMLIARRGLPTITFDGLVSIFADCRIFVRL